MGISHPYVLEQESTKSVLVVTRQQKDGIQDNQVIWETDLLFVDDLCSESCLAFLPFRFFKLRHCISISRIHRFLPEKKNLSTEIHHFSHCNPCLMCYSEAESAIRINLPDHLYIKKRQCMCKLWERCHRIFLPAPLLATKKGGKAEPRWQLLKRSHLWPLLQFAPIPDS